ncbi:glycoside hydrolase family 43 protein [Mangrovibacterium marinum]|uniref:Carbohydrate binding protein with CBM6 domain n=1 Tax=Mangrovibacterium marinum TaxID=1639118 RepID=A0A2T5BXH9_9BACT|nr:glycoside hydrolase family 43 protein [Mangrovibacterium marinum]PTN05040.1 carbohydrate binding protein with CBM6 domain [Mangrovibacterium marinum]
MKNPLKIVAILGGIMVTSAGFAQNPIIQTVFTADPAPMVYNDTVYLYTSHDEDSTPEGMGGFRMKDWRCYTSTDMVNWTDHGVIATLKDFTWGRQDNGAWAPQCIERNGKFYLYCPVQGSGIGVLVADSPYGPFKDPLGKRLIESDHIWQDIDPSVFIDDDGQAYLYWGNPQVWYVKLNEDMISYSGKVETSPEFVKVEGEKDPYHYQEGPWIYKRDGHYYLAYASTCCPEGIGYAMSDSPTGPWEFKGYIMRPNEKSSGNHPGIIEYKGKSYVFGFNYELNSLLTDKHHERRSICVDEFTYNPDGTIPEQPWWQKKGIEPVGTLNPFKRTEAETINWTEGVKTIDGTILGGVYVTEINNGDYIRVRNVDFGKGAKKFEAGVAALAGGSIEIRVDEKDGELLGTLDVKGDESGWITQSIKVKQTEGAHDVYFVFKGDDGDLFNFDWWKFVN